MRIGVLSMYYKDGYGVGYSVKKEIEELDRRGYKIFLVSPSETDVNLKKFILIPIRLLKWPVINIFKLRRDINKAIETLINESVDIYYINSLEFGLTNFKQLKKSKVVYFARSTIRGIKANKPKEYFGDAIRKSFIDPVLIYLEKKCFANSDIIVVKSDRMKKEIVNLYKVNPKKIKIISGSIDTNDFPEMNETEKISFKKEIGLHNEKVILFLGRITPSKGLRYLIKAFSIIAYSTPNIKLLIIGSSIRGKYIHTIRSLVSKLNIVDKTKFFGYIPQQNIYRYINVSDIVVVPSTYEPFGMTNLQAIALNKPLITTSVTGSLDLVRHYKCLQIVRPFKYEDIVNALNNVIKLNPNSCDGRNLIKNYTWSNTIDDLEKIFKN